MRKFKAAFQPHCTTICDAELRDLVSWTPSSQISAQCLAQDRRHARRPSGHYISPRENDENEDFHPLCNIASAAVSAKKQAN